MTSLQRSVAIGALNFTLAPLIMAMGAYATGVDAGASLAVAYAMFWPAFLANAGFQIEIHSPEWTERRKRFADQFLVWELGFLPLLVLVMLWLNPGVALLLQDSTGWLVGAAAAGGANRMVDALRNAAENLLTPKHEKQHAR